MKSKRLLIMLLACSLSSAACFAQVGVGTDSPDSTAILDVSSSSKGLIMPRLTTASINAIVSPASGTIVFNADSGKFFGYGSRGSFTNVDSFTSYNTTFVGTPMAQSFTASSSYTLSAVSFFIGRNGGTGAITLTASLYSGDGTGGTLLGITTLTISGTAMVLTRAVFPAGIRLQSGAQYTLLLVPGSASLAARVQSGDQYAGGKFYAYGAAYPNYDLVFWTTRANQSWHALD